MNIERIPLERRLEDYARLVLGRGTLHESPPFSVARETAARFPRYSNSVTALPAHELAKVRNIANRIIESSSGGRVLTVHLIGHSDNDPQRERREPGFMQRMSVARAGAVKDALENMIKGKVPPSHVKWDITGVGNRRLVVVNPLTEADRQRNRRVDIILSSQPVDLPIDCTQAQDDQVDLAEAAAVFFMSAILKRKATPQRVDCWESRHTLPFNCDIPFSNDIVIAMEVRPTRIHVIVAEADKEPALIGKGCWLTYACLRSGGFRFFPAECTGSLLP